MTVKILEARACAIAIVIDSLADSSSKQRNLPGPATQRVGLNNGHLNTD